MEKIFGYTVCYQKLAMSVSLLTHILAVFLAVGGILAGKNFSTDFLKLMKNYNNKHSSKLLVDEIQLLFECCGSLRFDDWYSIQWQKSAQKR